MSRVDESNHGSQQHDAMWDRLWRAACPALKVIASGLVSWALRKILG